MIVYSLFVHAYFKLYILSMYIYIGHGQKPAKGKLYFIQLFALGSDWLVVLMPTDEETFIYYP